MGLPHRRPRIRMNRWRSETRLCCFLSPTLLDTSRICSVVAPGSGFAAVLPSDFVSAVARSRSGRSRQCVGRMEHQTCMKMMTMRTLEDGGSVTRILQSVVGDPTLGMTDKDWYPSTPHTPMDLVSRYTKNCRPIYQTITTQYSRLGLQNPSSPSSNFRSTIRSSPIDLSCSVNVLYEEVPPRMVVMPLRDQGVSRPRVGGL